MSIDFVICVCTFKNEDFRCNIDLKHSILAFFCELNEHERHSNPSSSEEEFVRKVVKKAAVLVKNIWTLLEKRRNVEEEASRV